MGIELLLRASPASSGALGLGWPAGPSHRCATAAPPPRPLQQRRSFRLLFRPDGGVSVLRGENTPRAQRAVCLRSVALRTILLHTSNNSLTHAGEKIS